MLHFINQLVAREFYSTSLPLFPFFYRTGSLFPGDILLEFNGRPVNSLDQVHSMMQQTSSALNCDLTVKAPNSEGFLRPGLQYKHNPSKSKVVYAYLGITFPCTILFCLFSNVR